MRLPPGQLALMAPCRALHTPAAISLPAPVTVSTISYLVGFVKHHHRSPAPLSAKASGLAPDLQKSFSVSANMAERHKFS
jgi:hypothetical protein